MTAGGSSNADRRISLEEEVDFLRRPDAYGGSEEPVAVVETHKSWVFLTEAFAYKLKKAIRYDSVDFRSLESRLANSSEEVRLNRRLAHDVYLGIEPLTLEPGGSLALGGHGRPVDWLVKMRRLPVELMMDRMILNGSLGDADVEHVAAKLARFYQAAEPALRNGNDYRKMLALEIGINERDLLGSTSFLDAGPVRTVIALQHEFLDRHQALLDRRAEQGRVVEGHGDLRPEHICLQAEPAIIDCLEFSQRLRIVDAIDELAFLSLQCELLGAPWIQRVLLDTYVKITGDDAPERLNWFYKSYRAAIWARLAVWRARDISGDGLGKWVTRGRAYLDLSLDYARRCADSA